MRAIFVAAVLLAVASAMSYDDQFAVYKQKFSKVYASPAEEALRRQIFEANMKWADELNGLNPLARFGMTQYTDVDRAEFKKTHHNADFSQHLKNRKPQEFTYELGTPEKIDWRSKGAVTHVKNQEQCGGCWSFSTTGNIEGQWMLAGHTLVSLSEQELLSCDTTGGNEGCNGGLMDYAFEWLVNDKDGIIETAASYPFVSGSGTAPACSTHDKVNGAKINGHHDISQTESAIKDYCGANGPVSIGVDASSFQTYEGGILTNCQDGQLDHAVLIVGYDLTHSTPYWIIKNSWGTSWGEEGYIRVEYGQDECGLNQAATSSTVTANGPPVPQPSGQPPSPPSPPSPTPPSPFPPSPPSPPSPSGSNYTFYLCQDSGCSDCQQYSFPQGDCVEEQFNGDSFTATCASFGLKVHLNTYVGSTQCSGSPSAQHIWTDTCYENVDRQTYVKFKCPGL